MTSTESSVRERVALPGRLGDPGLSLATDPRLKPGLRDVLARFGLDALAGPGSVSRSDSAETIFAAVGHQDAGFNGLYAALPDELPGDDAVSVTVAEDTVCGADGNDIAVRIFRPAGATGTLPAVMYIHGGGMTILDSFAKVHLRWCADLAATGLVVVAVDFRNAWTAAGPNPFPAGLTDCSAALDWVHEHRRDLGIGSLVVQGESGGANLTLATSLKANREGRLDRVQGVYASVPYISGGYGWDEARKLAELPSMVENDGLFLNCQAMDLLVAVYDPDGADALNPLAWPYFAGPADLAGLPPHVITVNELDPLRDEGLAYYRMLLGAGVPAVGRVNLGLVHGAELIFRQAVADDRRAAVHDISRFAYSV